MTTTTLVTLKQQVQQLLQQPPALYTGPIDGELGAGSRAAFERLAVASGAAAPAPVVLNPREWPLEADAAQFFGDRPSLTQIAPPYSMRMNYDGAWHKITAITCHVLVAASLRRILDAIWSHFAQDLDRVQAAGLDVYDGCYNDRNVRGSSTKKSMHSFGAAIDLDADHNPLGATTGRMPAEVVAIFKAEGWRWGGDYQGRKDWMHFEACR